MKHPVLIVTLLSVCLLLAALITRNGDLALMALPFLIFLGTGILQAPSPETIRLNATRALNITSANGKTVIAMCVTLRNEGARLISLRLFDPLQKGMKLVEGDLKTWVALAPGEETEFRYTFETERGAFSWSILRAVASDPFGLFETELKLPAQAEIQVQPRTGKFRAFPLRPESTLHAPGLIPAHQGGSGTDFWGLREYHPGDSLRHIDWRLTARHPRQFFTKEFEQEEVADIGLILDARQGSDVWIGNDSLFEHTLSATASLAEVLLHQGHRVSLLVFGEQMTAVYPGYSKAQLNRILRTLAKVRLGQNNAQLSLDFVPLRMFSSRALIVVLSPLANGDHPFFSRLRARGNQGLLICPDPIAFARHHFSPDQTGQLSVRAARLERKLELRKITQLNVRVIDWRVDEPLSPLIRRAFRPARGRQG